MCDKIVFGDVARTFLGEFIEANNPCARVKKVLTNLSECGTEAMGNCLYHCWDCGHEEHFHLSCRNRHCPSCHTHHKEQWLEARMSELLPVQYFHVVFTVPDILHPAILGYREGALGSLFKAASETLKEFGKRKGVQLGMTMVLHTWGSNMSFHPHLHVLVPGGGINLKTGKWVDIKPCTSKSQGSDAPNNGNDKETASESSGDKQSRKPFLFPVEALSVMFRAKYIDHLARSCGKDVLDRATREECFRKGFVVYAKAPAAGPEQVLEYLARYSFGIAISNSRIVGINGHDVSFKYKDYRDGGKSKIMCLDGVEFVRRFSMHILPEHFTRIRHYGFLSPSNREKLKDAQQQLASRSEEQAQPSKNREEMVGSHALRCGMCQSLNLHISIGAKKKKAVNASVPRIRSPAYLQTAV